METGWLLDDGSLCIGASPHGLTMLAYTSPSAIRFARWEDAERFRRTMPALGMPLTAANVKAIEHAWFKPGVTEKFDA